VSQFDLPTGTWVPVIASPTGGEAISMRCASAPREHGRTVARRDCFVAPLLAIFMSRWRTPDHESGGEVGVAWLTSEGAQARSSVIDGVEVDSQSGPGILMYPVLSVRGRETMCLTMRMPPAASVEEARWR
jgi:hypothetical protein